MADVIPAIIPQSLAQLRDTVNLVRQFASSIQVDVVDGVFATPASWPYGEGEKYGEVRDVADLFTGLDVELDLMVSRPHTRLQDWVAAGAKRVVVHFESVDDPVSVLSEIRLLGAVPGLAFDDDTDMESLMTALSHTEFVQCMGIDRVGSQGQPFEPKVLENIRAIRAAFPRLPVSVDGGVNETTLPLLKAAGATRFITGSAILFADDPRAAYISLQAMANQ